jgi:hypothetical protein
MPKCNGRSESQPRIIIDSDCLNVEFCRGIRAHFTAAAINGQLSETG